MPRAPEAQPTGSEQAAGPPDLHSRAFQDQSTSTPRWVTEDLELAGKTLQRGDAVRFGLGAAKRDPEQFADPERFDIGRMPNRHLSFGRGAHFCLGASLARLVGEVAITAVLDQMPDIQLVTEHPCKDPRRMDRYEQIRVRGSGRSSKAPGPE